MEEETEEHKELYALLQHAAVLMVKVGYTAIGVTAEVAGKEEQFVFENPSDFKPSGDLYMTLKGGTPPTGRGPKTK